MTKPLPLWSRNFEASSNINPEVESALSAAAGIALTFVVDMIKGTIIALFLICVAIIIAWYAVPSWRPHLENASSVFSLVASIIALTVFIQFVYTFQEEAKAHEEIRKSEKAKFTARITALSSEILSNISVCNLFESEKEDYLSGKTVPGIRYEYSVAQNMIQTGEITHHRLRAELMSVISQMRSLNTAIEHAMQLMIFKSMTDPSNDDRIRNALQHSSTHIVNKSEKLRKQLGDMQPLIEEFYKSPLEYGDEKYLKDKLIPDALIR